MINTNDSDPGLLHVDRAALNHDFIFYDVKYVKNLNKIDNIYMVFNDVDVIFRKSGKDKY